MLLLASLSFAQGIQLSAEQQRMLDQLPPAQRQQAMDAVSQFERSESAGQSQSLRESDQDRGATSDLSPVVSKVRTEDEPRADVGSRLVITFTPREALTKRERSNLENDPAFERLSGNRAFMLDATGGLSLPGLGVVPLLGLSEADISRRLAAEPYLAPFNIAVRILSTRPTGVAALKPFGYEIFEPHEGSFDPPMTGPVPPDYVLGPGDTVKVQLFGNVNGIYEQEVTRDGILSLPEIGPVNVSGIPFSEFRADVNKRVKETLIGTQVSVTMGQLRTIRVFVLGDVNQPGSYVVNSLATISSALYRSGGIGRVGSLRNIQLKRSGRLVTTLDLYDLLLKGDTSGDRRLRSGDVIFVPPIGKTISISGAVKRPAIYETRGRASIADAIGLAGGLAPDAFGKGSRIERIAANGERIILSIDLGANVAREMAIEGGDILLVPEVLPDLRDTVTLSGFVQRPGPYQWRPGMRLTDLITSTRELKAGVDTEYVLIRRERDPGQPIQVFSANLGAALQSPAGVDNVRLESRDTVHVFSTAMGRQRVVEPLLDELRLQSTVGAPAKQVQIAGNVHAPGVYPLEPGMRVSDLIRAGGNLTEAAFSIDAELTRYSTLAGDGREIETVNIDLHAITQGDPLADLALREHDYLIINRMPDWDMTWTVSLEGEMQFPGEYRVRPGETLVEVIQRAGGFTEMAFVEGAVFLRESLREQEQEQIDTLARRLEADVASLSLQESNNASSNTLTTGKILLDQLRTTEAVGRLVINLDPKGNNDSSAAAAVEMRDGDRLLVPQRPQVVTVLGETQQNTSHLYRDDLSRDEYIELSGGLTRRADKKLIYVVRANGAVVAGNRSRWLGRGGRVGIRPGDTIVVPLDTDRMRPLTFWGNVTQILYQGAIAVAAVKTFNN